VVPANPKDPRDTVKHAYKLADGTIVFLGKFEIDADGAPKAYGPDAKGLDKLANAGSSGDWWGLATDRPDCGPSGNPVLQTEDDPAPGFYVSTTSMRDPAVRDCHRQRKYVDSTAIPYVALASVIAKVKHGRGSLVAVKKISKSTVEFAVHADGAPAYGIGEGSIYLAHRLGLKSDPRNGGESARTFVYLILNDTMSFPHRAEEVQSATSDAFQRWGGIDRLTRCEDQLTALPQSNTAPAPSSD
jgi:hypothetical protein